MRRYWSRQGSEFEELRARVPGSTYRDWQPTKWQSLALLRSSVEKHATEAGWPIRSAIELGCGSATLLSQLAASGVDCDGIDLEPEALVLARAAADSAPSSAAGRLLLHQSDFMDASADFEPADLAFSIGVIEHYFGERQVDVLRRHVALSRRWVLLAIPNMASPLFQAFLRAMTADGTVYDEHHVDIDIPTLATRLGYRVVIADGCHLFLSRARDYRFADAELRDFQQRLRPLLIALDNRFQAYPDMDITSADIEALMHVEAAEARAVRLRFGFLLWYLIDCGAP